MVITPSARTLGHTSTRTFVPDDPDALRGEAVALDLRSIRFVRPFGLVFLFWYVRWLLDEVEAARADVVLDRSNRDLCNYLKRMKVPDVFGELPVTIYPIQDLELHERELSTSLVELKSFRVDDDNAVERRTAETLEVVLHQRPDLGSRSEQLWLIVSELLSNIHVHSRTREAAIAVQAYRDRVEVALGDAGIGVAAALRNHVETLRSDGAYLRKALEPGVTSRPGGGGYGLTQLLEVVQASGGRIVMRSGKGELVASPGEIEATNTCRALPGTLLEIELPIQAS